MNPYLVSPSGMRSGGDDTEQSVVLSPLLEVEDFGFGRFAVSDDGSLPVPSRVLSQWLANNLRFGVAKADRLILLVDGSVAELLLEV